jgi:hypothetical protein
MTGATGKKRVTRKRVEFNKVPLPLANVAVLGGLVCDRRAELGSLAIVDFRGLSRFQTLARDFVAALGEYASPGQIANGHSISRYGQAVRIFLTYCEKSGKEDDLRMKDIDLELILDFRSYVRVAFSSQKSASRRRLFGNFGRLLKAGQELGLASPELEPPRNFKILHDSDVTQPYSAGEALDIEDVCRNHIRVLLARLARGQELLSHGKDPRGPAARDPETGKILSVAPELRAWNQLPNLLWFVVNVMDGQYVRYANRKASGLSSFGNATNGAFKGAYRKLDVFSHLYPLSEDLIPFVNLLAKTTGRNESSILGLSRDCVQVLDDKFILWYRKERSSTRLFKKVISSDGPYSPVALIRTLQEITAPLVKLASSEHQGLLFLGMTAAHKRGAGSVRPPDPAYLKAQMNREGGWCEQNELQTENGAHLKISLRRWRVYYLTLRYKRHGQLSRVSRDAAHTLSRTSIDYVNNDSTKEIHEQAIEDGIKAAVRVARPTVIDSESIPEAARALGASESVAEKILRGEQDVFISSCRDFYNKPGGPPNAACDEPWECFECGNSVITRHVLPRVIAFRDFMLQQKIELSPRDWAEKFGRVWTILSEAVLPRFSVEAIAEAERYAAIEKFYIPISLKA